MSKYFPNDMDCNRCNRLPDSYLDSSRVIRFLATGKMSIQTLGYFHSNLTSYKKDAHCNLDDTVVVSVCADVNRRRCGGDDGDFGTC